MKSMFRAPDKDEIVHRIHALRPDTPRQWGKMEAAQMLVHSQVGIQVALGDLQLKRVWLGYVFGGFAKRHAVGPDPLRRGLPTGREFVIAGPRDLARERDVLVALIERFHSSGGKALVRDHPFFGVMSGDDWDRLTWKHLDHHLRQFAIV
jgi:hypothetical protein